jgi:hypothetical protein
MPSHTFSGQDYLVVVTAAILMIANLLGAGFTITRLWIRARPERATSSRVSWWSVTSERPLKVLRVTSFSVIILVLANVWVTEGSHALNNVIAFILQFFSQ